MRKRMLAVLLASVTACSLGGCAGKKKDTVRTVKIGLTLYDQYDTFISELVSWFNASASALEEETGTAINVEVVDAAGSQTTQNEQVKSLIEKGCDVICVNLVDRTEPTTITDMAEKNDVPIIFFNRELVAEDLHQMSVPSVTLVNGKTAGEAELFAGVLQEFQLTTVVGENTAGKGRIQEFFPLKVDSSAVKLTVAQLSLLQSGGLEGKGIAPTKLISLTESQTTDFELLTETTDPQLKAALSILTGGAATTPTEPTGGADSTATQATTTTAAAQ